MSSSSCQELMGKGCSVQCPGAHLLLSWAKEEDALLHALQSNTAQVTPFHLVGAEKCQKPQWDSKIVFDQEQGIFNPNEVVKIRCPEGYWPPPMEIKCVALKPREGSMIPHSGWIMRNGTDTWRPVEGNLTCVGK